MQVCPHQPSSMRSEPRRARSSLGSTWPIRVDALQSSWTADVGTTTPRHFARIHGDGIGYNSPGGRCCRSPGPTTPTHLSHWSAQSVPLCTSDRSSEGHARYACTILSRSHNDRSSEGYARYACTILSRSSKGGSDHGPGPAATGGVVGVLAGREEHAGSSPERVALEGIE